MELLFKKLCNKKELEKAYRQMDKSNSYSHGLSGKTMSEFQSSWKSNIDQISNSLINRTYSISSYRGTTLTKPNGDLRPLLIPEIKDRVVLKALVNILDEHLRNRFNLNNGVSFAYLEGLGVSKAWERVVEHFENGNEYCLEADMVKFYDSIDRKVLLEELLYPELEGEDYIKYLVGESIKTKVGNFKTLSLKQKKAFPKSTTGIPQGNPLSPFLSNIYLSGFDKTMKKEGFGMVRYADDFVILCKSRKDCSRAFDIAKDFLSSNLNLSIYGFNAKDKKKRAKIVPLKHDKITFLSINYDGNCLWPHKSKFTELKDKYRKLTRPKSISIREALERGYRTLDGWLSSYSFTDVDRYADEIDEFFAYETVMLFEKKGVRLNKKYLELTSTRISKEKKLRLDANRMKNVGIPTCKEILKKKRSKEGHPKVRHLVV